ncbi:hypothetical protein VZ95_16710, partial [Elstera litoralis]
MAEVAQQVKLTAMIFSLFGLTVAAFVGLVLGLIAPRLVPVPPPASRGLVVMLYGSFVLAGSIILATMTRELWAPLPPVVAVVAPMAPVEPLKAEPPPAAKPEPIPEPIPELVIVPPVP